MTEHGELARIEPNNEPPHTHKGLISSLVSWTFELYFLGCAYLFGLLVCAVLLQVQPVLPCPYSVNNGRKLPQNTKIYRG